MAAGEERLEIGSIIFEKVLDTTPPKEKYYIVTGFSRDRALLSTVYINSRVNPNVFHSQRLRDLHVEIPASDNPFLEYDSFVDCSYLHEKETAAVISTIRSDNNRYGYYASVSPECMSAVLEKIKTANTVPTYLKRKYGFC